MLIRFLDFLQPRKFDRYILSEVISAFFGSCIFILFILLMFQALRLAEFFIVHGASAYLLGKMTFFMAISILPSAFPLSFLLGVLISFSRLSMDGELIAMKACGIGVARMALPVSLFALVVVGFSIALNVKWVPWGEMEFKKTLIKLGNTKIVSDIKEGTFNSGFFDLLVFADKVDTRTNRMQRVFIYDEREPKNPMAYVASEAEIVSVKTTKDLGAAIMLRLFDGSTHHNTLETHTYEKMDFSIYNLYLQISEGADTTMMKPHMIPQDALIQKIKDNPITTYEGKEFRGEYWRRYATALSPLVFVLLGIGFGTFRYRTAKTGAILTGFIILTFYWILQTSGTAAVQRGSLSPFFAMQLPNIILLILGIYSFRRAAW
jgi:lipopolysaccharide export system permease protein